MWSALEDSTFWNSPNHGARGCSGLNWMIYDMCCTYWIIAQKASMICCCHGNMYVTMVLRTILFYSCCYGDILVTIVMHVKLICAKITGCLFATTFIWLEWIFAVAMATFWLPWSAHGEDFAVAMDTFWYPIAMPVNLLCQFEWLNGCSLEFSCQYAHTLFIVAKMGVAMVIKQHNL